MIDWARIDSVLLDMDGTLLDLYFDNHFWLEYLPSHYAKRNALNVDTAKSKLFEEFNAYQGTLNWYCVDFWSTKLGFDVVLLKHDISNLIRTRPYAVEFLEQVKASGRRPIMVTNAHRKVLELKIAATGIDQPFERLVSSHDYGFSKEEQGFWQMLVQETGVDLSRSLFIDDSLPVLESAKKAGVGQLLAILQPDSQLPEKDTQAFNGLDCFSDIMPK